MQSLGIEKGEAIEHGMVNRSIEKAQRRVEGQNFDARKNLLEFDDVANDQRHYVYRQRNELMDVDDISEAIEEMRAEVVEEVVSEYVPPQSIEDQWDVPGLEQALAAEFNCRAPVAQWLEEDPDLTEEALRERVAAAVEADYAAKAAAWTAAGIDMRQVEKQLMLQVLDQKWKEHLAVMDHLRQGIHLRAYAQKQPKQEYKRESFALFQQLQDNISHDVIRWLSRIEVQRQAEIEEAERERRLKESGAMRYNHVEEGQAQPRRRATAEMAKAETFVRSGRKVGRNEPCPCGSGKKYKHCCGRASAAAA